MDPPGLGHPLIVSTVDGIRERAFPFSSAMALKAGPEPELHVNKCDETHPQTSLTLAFSTARNSLETVVLRDRNIGRSLFSLSTRRLLTRSTNCSANELCRHWEAAVARVLCASDVNRSRNDSQLPASAAPANTPDSWYPWRNSSTVDSSLSFPMSNTRRP